MLELGRGDVQQSLVCWQSLLAGVVLASVVVVVMGVMALISFSSNTTQT